MAAGDVVWALVAAAAAGWVGATLSIGRRHQVGPVALGRWIVASWLGRLLALAGWMAAGWHLFCQRP